MAACGHAQACLPGLHTTRHSPTRGSRKPAEPAAPVSLSVSATEGPRLPTQPLDFYGSPTWARTRDQEKWEEWGSRAAATAVATYTNKDPWRAILIAAGVGAVVMSLVTLMARSGARRVKRKFTDEPARPAKATAGAETIRPGRSGCTNLDEEGIEATVKASAKRLRAGLRTVNSRITSATMMIEASHPEACSKRLAVAKSRVAHVGDWSHDGLTVEG